MLLKRMLRCRSQRLSLLSSRIVGRLFGNSQTMLLCRRLRRWHGASFPSSVGSPVLLGLFEFSDWQLVQLLVEACHLVSSQAAHRHPQLVPVRESLRIAHAITCLVPLLHFHGTWINSCVSWCLSSLLWLHGLLIELQVDGESRECEGFIIVVFTETVFVQ